MDTIRIPDSLMFIPFFKLNGISNRYDFFAFLGNYIFHIELATPIRSDPAI